MRGEHDKEREGRREPKGEEKDVLKRGRIGGGRRVTDAGRGRG